ncbi:MAG: ATP-dependent RNA helicase HrpA [Acidimicrobiales bacterium]|nr:ATP-dependent RNA helicase HrpA [Acidimicrobiales bacterium]
MTVTASAVSYPPDLPITERREELLEAIRDHQVVVVAGETGSGKSTQLPKMCVELGLHEAGWIGHTQPRRIAARSIAERVAEELGSSVGELVGYKVRFTDRVSNQTAIKTMTDGILLAEMQHDRLLKKYSVIIVDEAHERSLNIDFLLGYLRQLLSKRPDLKVIITSATIDTERFSSHFGDAPIVEVSGRLHPVEMRYRPLDEIEDDPLTQVEGIVEAAIELEQTGSGDILVFCSGERDIREAAAALKDAPLKSTDILPLYGRLSAAEQHRVFDRPKGGPRRIVLATNVAETSITVPGIRFVIDPGTARISRYSHRTKVQRLPIEAISQASANQRAGRCGRLGPGVCIRLFSEESYEQRPEFTEPEITRTNLASVILQMAALGLGAVEQFPFVDPPELRNIKDGVALLEELDAVRPGREGTKKWLTPIGRRLARLPIDPRFGRMVIEAAATNCLDEVIIITAGLSIQDPRERPSDKSEAAAEAHRRFAVAGSDFLSWIRLWNYVEEERAQRTGNQFRRMCRQEFLHFNRLREWQDIVRQLRSAAKSQGWERNASPATDDRIHEALLTGLLSHVGVKDSRSNEFAGGRNARFLIGRSSTLSRKPPTYVMAGELVETNRLWAHSAARIQPEWAEKAGAHVAKRSYDEPDWDADMASAMTIERVTLYGVPIVTGRRVHYRKVDPDVARELFIHHALIEGDWTTHHAFFEQNESVLDEVRQLGARQRRDLFVEYDVLFDFYDDRVDRKVTSGADFDRWWNQVRIEQPRLLDLKLEEIFDANVVDIGEEEFPDAWQAGDLDLAISYDFDTGAEHDGVTITVPLAVLGHLDPAPFEWNIVGVREELVTALMRSMPKSERKPFVPIPDTVREILPELNDESGSLLDSLRRILQKRSGASLSAEALSMDRLPNHLRPRFRIIDDDGEQLAVGRDLEVLHDRLQDEVRSSLASGAHELAATGQTGWTFGDLPARVETVAAGQQVVAYPALVDEGETVGVALLADPYAQRSSMWLGTRRLLRLNVGGAARALNELLDTQATLALVVSPHQTKVGWITDASDCIFARLLRDGGGPVRTEEAWEALVVDVRGRLPEAVKDIGTAARDLLVSDARLQKRLEAMTAGRLQAARQDISEQRQRLIYPNHLTGVGPDRVADLLRYVDAMHVRLDKLSERIPRDSALMSTCRSIEAEFDSYVDRFGLTSELEEINWMLEEFRVASFAQHLGVGDKVSERKIRDRLRDL